MKFSVLLLSLGLSIGLSHAALDHLPNSHQFNQLSGDKVSTIDRGRSLTIRKRHGKRDYATTLELLKAAVANYQQNTPPEQAPVEPAPAEPAPVEQAPVEPVPVEQLSIAPVDQMAPVILVDPQNTQITPTQESAQPATEEAPPPPPSMADIEEDDKFDPEEDPDDVDDPPTMNGAPTQREE